MGEKKNIKEAQKVLSSIVDNLPGMAYRCRNDEDWTMLFISNGCHQLTGYHQEDLIDNKITSYEKLIVEEDRAQIRKTVNSSLKKKSKFILEYRINTKKEGVKWVWEQGEGMFSKTGELLFIEGFISDVTDRKKYEIELQESRENYRALIDNSPDGIFIHDEKGYVLFANPSALKIIGVDDLNQLSSRSVFHSTLPEHHDMLRERGKLLNRGVSLPFISTKIRKPNNEIVEVESKPIKVIYSGLPAILVVYHEITVQRKLEQEQIRAQLAEENNKKLQEEIAERERVEAKMKKSLKEKEVLLKEVHHRVKNNLQVISSILNLQSSYVKDSYTLNMLKESQNRIKSMAFIHESLYQTKDFSSINFSEYVINLIQNLVHSYSDKGKEIKLNLDIDQNIQLSLDQSIPCGLIINELLSNSFKYAFPSVNKGTISVKAKLANKKMIIQTGDDGVGLPTKIDFKNTESLGLQLVVTLVDQLNGIIALKNNQAGTNFIIKFDINSK